jgi:nicotinate-nucleotide adenylyltransferase
MQEKRLASASRLGILGGTFDPIHFGHLAIAEEARLRYALDAVLFIPAGEPPHKPAEQAPAEQRYLMTALATADHPDFFVSRMEIDRIGPSYTLETLQELADRYPRAARYFIIGADAALDFPAWREPRAIAGLATIIAATRPGFDLANLFALWSDHDLPRPEIMPAPGLDISATLVRNRARAGEPLRYLTPDPVARYIDKTRIYRDASGAG